MLYLCYHKYNHKTCAAQIARRRLDYPADPWAEDRPISGRDLHTALSKCSSPLECKSVFASSHAHVVERAGAGKRIESRLCTLDNTTKHHQSYS